MMADRGSVGPLICSRLVRSRSGFRAKIAREGRLVLRVFHDESAADLARGGATPSTFGRTPIAEACFLTIRVYVKYVTAQCEFCNRLTCELVGLVQSGRDLVEFSGRGQRRERRVLAAAVRLFPDGQSTKWHASRRVDGRALRGLCFWLRVPIHSATG